LVTFEYFQFGKADIHLLASVDERHGQPSGALLEKLCGRDFEHYDQGYSVSQ